MRKREKRSDGTHPKRGRHHRHGNSCDRKVLAPPRRREPGRHDGYTPSKAATLMDEEDARGGAVAAQGT